MASTVLEATPEGNQSQKQKQVNNIAMITFWSQFSVYVLNTILVLYLTRPILARGLGYSEASAYAFIGVSQAMGYVMPMLGGQMADKVVGLVRSILIGSVLLAIAYLLVMLSGFTVSTYGDTLFIAAYALVPVTNSLLMGTASGVVSKIYSDDEAKAKSGMTLYYMSINVGSLLATILAPQLFESRYGPLSIFAVVFLGKALSALNYAWRYQIYDNITSTVDKAIFDGLKTVKLISYIVIIYLFTLFAYFHPYISSYIIGVASIGGLGWFLIRTLKLQGELKIKQCISVILILEAIVFFVLYNQMNTTLVLFAKNNSDLNFLGFHVSPAHYQMINPAMIIGLSLGLPKFYERFRHFTIPFQFASGTILGGVALLLMYFACQFAQDGLINGNFIVLTYVCLSLAELWVSAVGLSMIGLYCCHTMIAFAMGVWYLSNSLSYVISGQVAQWVALPSEGISKTEALQVYRDYYFDMGLTALLLGFIMFCFAIILKRKMGERNVRIV